MPQLTWQKSSFSGGGEGSCVELAAATATLIHLRESDRPYEITTVAPQALACLLHMVKAGTLKR
ncbi:DUF397 domain-containing protein [Streptomyces capitiformicae]|uniref:DUF397 domain-containing protein n=1 Tax=Streptomyces capitiformicae TaxID=2014920 RepID=A0A919D9Y2_9ACTN|nr:DUF397 domain-containing protein [Streptomyces capitiformicae]GHE27411.1 hypothetical protein GCM10017771_42070 [Streptomyces capitiformicae]